METMKDDLLHIAILERFWYPSLSVLLATKNTTKSKVKLECLNIVDNEDIQVGNISDAN
jgi:hypothetical protein